METKERGITLIALIVTIVILIILAMIVLKTITGDEGIILATQEATNSYIIQQYKEQLEQLVQSVIIKDALLGKDTTLESLAEEIEAEDWIKSAVADKEAGDIIATTTDGYIYEIIYDLDTGEREVIYAGKEEAGDLPTVSAEYDASSDSITVTASCTDGIEKIEIIFDGDVCDTCDCKGNTSGSTTYNCKGETGWFTVKVTSSNGQSRYTKVRVYDQTMVVTLSVTSNGCCNNGWYGADNTPVTVTITAEGKADTICYRKGDTGTYTEVMGPTCVISVSTSGYNYIYAYARDGGSGKESDIESIVIKYDNIAPEIGTPNVNTTWGNNGWCISDVDITLPDLSDDLSGVDTYYVWKVTGTETAGLNMASGTSYWSCTPDTCCTVVTEGTTTLNFVAKDQAGNVGSAPYSLTIQKDSQGPEMGTPTITNQQAKSFTINASIKDDISGVEGLYYYVGDELLNSTISVETSYTATVAYANQSYTVYVKGIDKAGNMSQSSIVTAATQNTAPVLTKCLVSDKTTDSITISAAAIDADGDGLTYYVYVGTASASLELKLTGSISNNGSGKSLVVSRLSSYTTYFYRVDVSDGYVTTSGSVQSERTYCPGDTLSCDGGYWSYVETTCPTCSGAGYRYGYRCYGTFSVTDSYDMKSSGTCANCGATGPVYWDVGFTCDSCGKYGATQVPGATKVYWCFGCLLEQWQNSYYKFADTYHWVMCDNCGGDRYFRGKR